MPIAVAMETASAIRQSRALWVLAAALLAAQTAALATGGGPRWATSAWLPVAAIAICAACVGARALASPSHRGAWGILAAGLGLYAAGTAVSVAAPVADPASGFPNAADLLWLALYPLAIVAVGAFAVGRRPCLRGEQWLDGIIGALAVATVGVGIIFSFVVDAGQAVDVAPSNVAFAIGDLTVIGFGVGAAGLLDWRPPRALIALLAGFGVLAVQDTFYLAEISSGSYAPGTLLDAAWVAAILAIATGAAWTRPRRTAMLPKPRLRTRVGAPVAFTVAALAIGGREVFVPDPNRLTVALFLATLLTGTVRATLAMCAQLTLLEATEREALTDALTGLGNRRRLLRDAETAVARATLARPVTLAIFDLDGFKSYNDSYGHPAGDALLARLGAKLAWAVAGRGEAYRLGGDEFCVLLWGDARGREQALAAAGEALREEGEAFVVSSSVGSAVVPDDAGDLTQALRRADQRLYAAKDQRATGTRTHAVEMLRRVLDESQPELGEHHHQVGALAATVAARLGLTGADLVCVERAAELHDIGKIAIPDLILHKPGPLDDDEWRFMRRHTAIGERFLASIPSLRGEARLVRSSHERFDGGGYPDGLAGEEIPLGSRIIFACDSYDAMTADRPYRAGMTAGDAIDELRRNSGTQFDPAVVAALCDVLSEAPSRSTLEAPAS